MKIYTPNIEVSQYGRSDWMALKNTGATSL